MQLRKQNIKAHLWTVMVSSWSLANIKEVCFIYLLSWQFSYRHPPNTLLHFGHITIFTGSTRALILVLQDVFTISFDSFCVKSLFWTHDSLHEIADWQTEQNAQAGFIQYVEKDFGFLINIFLLFQGSILGLGALLWHSVPRGQPWDKYWITAYMANKVNISAGDNWKKTPNLHFTGKHTDTSSRNCSTKSKGWGASKTPQMSTFVLFQCLVPRELSSLPCQHLQSNKCTCALWVRSFQKKMLTTPKDHLANE